MYGFPVTAAQVERERLEDIQHARAMITAYRANGNGEALKAWENILQRLEERGQKHV